ncbi:hypothetical protein XA68_13242 [Ophiocordyceps unilateralis]|uniref:RRM domain-containing protein n=1 Tax=Ophiocordyceps unilateralis TaxID=268505 RepID=A0A2A9PNM8_OPHUN|nr:hypothetical protein XA68_13242 [Ophiocordyceps unilateralis]
MAIHEQPKSPCYKFLGELRARILQVSSRRKLRFKRPPTDPRWPSLLLTLGPDFNPSSSILHPLAAAAKGSRSLHASSITLPVLFEAREKPSSEQERRQIPPTVPFALVARRRVWRRPDISCLLALLRCTGLLGTSSLGGHREKFELGPPRIASTELRLLASCHTFSLPYLNVTVLLVLSRTLPVSPPEDLIGLFDSPLCAPCPSALLVTDPFTRKDRLPNIKMAEAEFEIDFYGDATNEQQQDGPKDTENDYQDQGDAYPKAAEQTNNQEEKAPHQGAKRKPEEDDRLTTIEHKVNGKSKGQAYIEFETRQAATAVKHYVDQIAGDATQPAQKKISASYWGPGLNPFRTLPKDAPARGKEQPRAAPSGPYNDRGNYGGFRGRGNFNAGRGNMGQGNFNNRNFNNMGYNNMMGGPMGGGGAGGNFGFGRGGMMGGGMRGGPGGMRGGRGGNMMGMPPMGMPSMGMPGNMASMGMMGMGGGMPGFQGMNPGFSGPGFGFGQNPGGGGGGGGSGGGSGDWGNPHGAKRPRPE